MSAKFKLNLFSVCIILICIGAVMIYSASSIYAWERYGDGFFFLKRHLVFLLIGLFLTFMVMSYDYKKIRHLAKPLLLLSLLLLVLVLIPGIGREVSGARRWFRLKFISFQPSELANLAIIIYIADFIARKANLIKDFTKGFLPPIFIL
ncbi:MAG: FtsW/RodA/SpoVE family cell cycle protein, partial [Candidatus Omnitrophota bacterium]|nr:FtsW/RodA/SpoVE family cell cycle protein [Candidatus Omnitrophota bacterium]